jgi:hypothetical protein
LQLQGPWSIEQNRHAAELQATQHESCRLRITILESSTSPDGGHKVKLTGVMVVEGGSTLAVWGSELETAANKGRPEEQ